MATIITNQATLNYRFGSVSTSTVSNITAAVIEGSFDLEKTALNESYRAGQNITYFINVSNNGPVLENLTVDDNLGSYEFGELILTPLDYVGPARLFINGAFVSNLTPIAEENGITFLISSIPAGGNAQIIYQAKTNEFAGCCCGCEITNTVSAECDCTCNTPAVASNTIIADCFADLRIVKSVCPNPIVCGENISYVFDITNYGNIPATDVVLTDVFTPPLTDLTVIFNGEEIPATDYSYVVGVLTIPGEGSSLDLTVPASTCEQDPATGVITATPGKIQIIVSGTI